jgi:C4-type Zn-finger protein
MTAQPADRCPICGGHMQVVNTKIVGNSRIRYYGCRACGFRPADNKVTVPIQFAPPRNFRVGATSSTEVDTSPAEQL